MNDRLPFVPAWLDDAGLTPIQFRIMMHLWRRAGAKRQCWPGAKSMREVCKVSDDSLWVALAALEARGFLRREKRRYNANVYILTLPDVTGKSGVTRDTMLPAETGEHRALSPELSGALSPELSGALSPAETGYKVSPLKFQKDGVCVNPHTWPAALSKEAADGFAADTGTTAADVHVAFAARRDRELKYHGPWDERASSSLRDDLRELVKARPAKTVRSDFAHDDYSKFSAAAPEPANWRERLRGADADWLRSEADRPSFDFVIVAARQWLARKVL